MHKEFPPEAASFIRDKALRSLKPTPRSIALFGSCTRNEQHTMNDLDLLLVGNAIPCNPYLRTQWFFPLAKVWRNTRNQFNINLSLSPLIMTEEGWQGSIGLQLSLCDHAWILWDDGFLSKSLNQAKKLILEKKWSRKNLHKGGWIWFPRKEVA